MRVAKCLAIISLSLLISGCPWFGGGIKKPEDEGAKLGLGVKSLDDRVDYFSSRPKKNYYYGQLYIETKIFDDAIMGPESRTLSDYVLTTFGEKKKQFGVMVSPKLNGMTFPEVLLFSYKYDSSKGEWKSRLATKYSSPAFPLGDLSAAGFEFKYVASDGVDVNLDGLLSGFIDSATVLKPGGWVVSEASKKVVGDVAKNVNDAISDALSSSREGLK